MIDPTLLFKALADETRLRCLMLMVSENELCVCELGHALGMAQPKISRHLAMLRKVEIVQDRRDGQWIYYRIHPDIPTWAHTIIHGAAQGSDGMDPFRDDNLRLAEMPNRPTRCFIDNSENDIDEKS
ncbi:MAG: metalloregulator ArsR/SmtB family transcription factor [Magnetococcales bacterium]|nr:metalloregulator ArsR/SmtB family transcription factor [Magnetococcales bacterium]